MILQASAQRHNRASVRVSAYYITARQVRWCIACGCVGGMVAIPVLCWVADRFNFHF